MELSKQVISLEIAQRMDKLGIKGESYFVWIDVTDNYNVKPELCKRHENQKDTKGTYGGNGFKHEGPWEQKYYPAYTVAELGEMFAEQGEIEMPKWNARLKKWERELAKGGWISEDTEANARGLLLCYLKENNLI